MQPTDKYRPRFVGPAARRPVRRRRWGRLLATGFLVVLLTAVAIVMGLRRTVEEPYDLVIHDAEIIDGTGAPPFIGSVAVRRDRIVEVRRGHTLWTFLALPAKLTIDGSGLTLSPGFIDTHSHADFSIGEGSSPIHADNFVQQGVTTIVVGNCGRSSKDIAAFGRLLKRRTVDVNMASLIGLNTVRSLVMKDVPRSPTAVEVATMCGLVESAMRSGAVGASTGYAYVPGRFATENEIRAQLRVVAAFGGIHASHIRDEGAGILQSIAEATGVSGAAGVPVLISHLKISGRRNCSEYGSLLAELTSYAGSPRSRGIFFDQYPYSASSSSLELYLPTWFLALSHSDRIHAIRTAPAHLRSDMTQLLAIDGFQDFSFARVASFLPQRGWQGMTIAEIDASLMSGHSTVNTQLDLLLRMLEQGGAQMVYHNICEDVMLRLPSDLVLMVGSDSAIRYDDGTGVPHPRGWGTFPRFLRTFAANPGRLGWPEAIRRITDLPAQVFGLRLRGRIKPGYFADLVLFDRAHLRDTATFREPFLRPQGLRYVIVNGQPVIESRSSLVAVEGVATGRCPGRFLRPSPSARHRTAMGLVAAVE